MGTSPVQLNKRSGREGGTAGERIVLMNDKKIFHKSTFDKISREKRDKIIRVATEELATKGLENAKMGNIATRLDISYGSMYSYFATKDDLIHTIIQAGVRMQRETMEPERDIDNTLDMIRHILRKSITVAQENPEMISIWCELSFQYNERFSLHVIELEKEGILQWKKILNRGSARGDISDTIDLDSAAYVLDSITANLMRAQISDHEKKKLSIHYGASGSEDILERVMNVIRRMLTGTV